MKQRILTNKKGVTLLEGLIAIGLLAMVSVATFGVLLSISRQSSQPDLREEMLLAVERAHEGLQYYVRAYASTPAVTGLCGGDSTPFATGTTHTINCMLPAICDLSNSSFTYTVEAEILDVARSGELLPAADTVEVVNFQELVNMLGTQKITFNITCNGFTL